MDIEAEKMLEALVEDLMTEMGLESADDCYTLRRIQGVMLEMKSSNNAEVLRQIGYLKRPFDGSKCFRWPGYRKSHISSNILHF
ncbi:MAG: hypothetical protein LUQ09_02430 [Methanomassiliicoccales archaeon]|nr:hypothetical protein [Methanomassiliicoccales archaeon]